MSVNPDILKYYADLLIVQYKNKDKARKTIELLVNQAICDGIAQDEGTCFNLDTAIGAQLDIIATIVGVPRQVYGLDLTRDYFNLTNYSSAASESMASYSDAVYPTDVFFLRYRFIEEAIYTILDSEMRTLIPLKIALNTKTATTKNITEILWDFFGDNIEFIDNKDMTIDYNISSDIERVMEVAVFLGFIPKPMGVEYTITYV